jgi:hypothetical protein
MPDLKPRTAQLIALYQRCERYRCLPYPGSLLEQPAWIMRLFDVIRAGLDRAAREAAEEERRASTRAALKAELNGQRRR